LVDYAIFVVTVFAFEYFLRGLLKEREDDFAIRFIAYSIFLWSSMELCRAFMVNPDMIIAASVYATLGLLLRAPKSSPIGTGRRVGNRVLRKSHDVPDCPHGPVCGFQDASAAQRSGRRNYFPSPNRAMDCYAFNLHRSSDNR
jgi:hypothetical protein